MIAVTSQYDGDLGRPWRSISHSYQSQRHVSPRAVRVQPARGIGQPTSDRIPCHA